MLRISATDYCSLITDNYYRHNVGNINLNDLLQRVIMEIMYEARLDTGAKYIARAKDSMNLKVGDWCVIHKEKQLDYGEIIGVRGKSAAADEKKLPEIERKATVLDKSKANENLMRGKSAYRTALKHIEQLRLPMKLLNAHYSFDRKLITFQFTAEGRVDFRELVKQLSQVLNTRIELRQIGVRDETAIIGGIGPCGEIICCKRFIKKFDSINVRMAKEQGISLNPGNISGLCGRLKCCLKYEYEGYLELDKDMPRCGAVCECEAGRGKVIDRNLLTQKVTLRIEDSEKTIVCPKEEVRIVYPDKYKISAGHTEEEDIFHGLNEEELQLLKELDEE